MHYRRKGYQLILKGYNSESWKPIIDSLNVLLFRFHQACTEESTVQKRDSPTPKGFEGLGQEEKPSKYRTALGRNIDKYRMECGWSYDDLAKSSGIDKKLILRHVQGAGAYPNTLKLYADTFTKQLGRIIKVADLKE